MLLLTPKRRMKPFPCKTGLHRKVRETKRRVLIPCLLATIPLFTASLLASRMTFHQALLLADHAFDTTLKQATVIRASKQSSLAGADATLNGRLGR